MSRFSKEMVKRCRREEIYDYIMKRQERIYYYVYGGCPILYETHYKGSVFGYYGDAFEGFVEGDNREMITNLEKFIRYFGGTTRNEDMQKRIYSKIAARNIKNQMKKEHSKLEKRMKDLPKSGKSEEAIKKEEYKIFTDYIDLLAKKIEKELHNIKKKAKRHQEIKQSIKNGLKEVVKQSFSILKIVGAFIIGAFVAKKILTSEKLGKGIVLKLEKDIIKKIKEGNITTELDKGKKSLQCVNTISRSKEMMLNI